MKIAVFMATGFEEIEGLTVVDLCRRAGIEVDMVSVTTENFVTGSHGIAIQTDKRLSELTWSEYDMLVLPGGMPGTKNLEACEELMEHVEDFCRKEKWIGAICAAPTVFGHRGLLQGRKACCYPEMEGELLGAKVSMDAVSVDGRIITSRGMGTAIEFGLAIIENLISKEKADKLASAIVYK